MPKYSRSEFATLCGKGDKDGAWLRVYIGRKKVVEIDGQIDSSNPTNRYFLERWQKTTAKSKVADVEETLEPPALNFKPEKKAPKVIKIASSDKEEEAAWRYDLDLSKKKLDNEKAQMTLRLQQLQLEKKMGEVIPVGIIKNVFGSYAKNITSSFHDGSEAFLIEISKRKGLSSTEYADFRGKLVKMINDSVERAIAESKKQIESIVQEYSTKREVGEHG